MLLGKLPSLKLFQNAYKHLSNTAIIDHNLNKQSFSYRQLLNEVNSLTNELTRTHRLKNQIEDLQQERVAFISEPGINYVRSQWAIWSAGGVAVPLALSHPPKEHHYTLSDSKPTMLITSEKMADRVKDLSKDLNIPLIVLPQVNNNNNNIYNNSDNNNNINQLSSNDIKQIDSSRNAMIIYTSGTTGKPKGCVSTHNNIESQVMALLGPWRWSSNDRILHTLPLHHVHGVINALTCPLYCGATVEMMSHFDAAAVTNRVVDGFQQRDVPISVFMAVPTIYSKLIENYDHHRAPEEQKQISEAWNSLRLMVSGSASLPTPLFERWHQISGTKLLERYGMTEIGMALSNGYDQQRRFPGTVGSPLPMVDCKVDEEGQLLVRGPQVFKEYWGKPEETVKNFTKDGYFKTGDTVSKIGEIYRILGRTSVDIIKSAGYKISALEIEYELLAHPSISEAAVIGIPSEEYGQVIGVLLVAKPSANELSYDEFKQWCSSRLAHYKIPRKLQWVKEIPKNAMLKVNKKSLVELFK